MAYIRHAAEPGFSTPPPPPTSTTDLLRFALEGGDSTRELSRKLGMNSNALNLARHRGQLSPLAAAKVAKHVGFNPTPWIALATIEAEPDSPERDALLAQIKRTLNDEIWRRL